VSVGVGVSVFRGATVNGLIGFAGVVATWGRDELQGKAGRRQDPPAQMDLFEAAQAAAEQKAGDDR